MTTPQILNELAAKIESLDGPCREMDTEIAKSVCWFPHLTKAWKKAGHRYEAHHAHPGTYVLCDKFGNPMGRHKSVFKYTKSIDASVSLVPDGWRVWDIDQTMNWHCGLDKGETSVNGRAKIEPLARTAAALRARASELKINQEP